MMREVEGGRRKEDRGRRRKEAGRREVKTARGEKKGRGKRGPNGRQEIGRKMREEGCGR
jgi:hypothetical protein